MDIDLFWKTITLFNFVFALLWIIFYTYQPFTRDEDFVRPGQSVRGSSADNTKQYSDKYLSDSGRTLIFLYGLITAIIVSFLYVVGIKYFVTRKMIKCGKGAKNPKECKLVDV
mgnify:CR=1 FL=1